MKYGIQTHLSHSPLPQKLEELRDYLRREIKKELKIMEGAENLRKVATDKKSVSNVNIIVKKSNSKLTELQQELQELESQILVSQGQTLNASLAGNVIVLFSKVAYLFKYVNFFFRTYNFPWNLYGRTRIALST